MALSTPRIIGRDLAVTCSGSKTIWESCALEFDYERADASAADSELIEEVFVAKRLRGTLNGLLGSVNNGGTLPAVGDAIDDLAVKVGSDSTLPALTDYTDIKVSRVRYDFKKGPAAWSIEFSSGLLN